MVSGVENFSNTNYFELQSKLKAVSDKQGVLGKAWNGFKEFSGLGKSESDCESMLEKYKNGSISFDEALSYIEDFEKRQDNASELISNLATGVGAIAFTTATAGAGTIVWATAAKAAPIGAAIKSGVNMLDRATNDVEGDALDVKEVTKDVISGAVTGTTSAVSSGIFKGRADGTMALSTSIKNGAKCGVACGSLSGSTSYLTDVALDEDKEFSAGDLIKNTATSALVSGTVGGAVGAGAYNSVAHNGIFSQVNRDSLKQAFTEDSVLSSIRKIAGDKVKAIFNSVKSKFA